MLNCHFIYMNSSDILWQYRVPYANISSIEKYIMWVIIKYLHWKNGSFEIYPAPPLNLSLHRFSQFPLDVLKKKET